MGEGGRYQRHRKVRGQSTLEYILVLAAVLLALIAAATVAIRPAADQTLNQAGAMMQNSANKLINVIR